MRYLAISLVLATCNAFATGAAAGPEERDGVWLQNGIKQQQRLSAHESLSEKDAHDALVVSSYICGVVDFEKYLVHRAALLESAVRRGKNKKQPIDPRLLAGMVQALPLVAPLMRTDFLSEDPSCERSVVIVADFLDKYPEMIDKDAGELIEKALLAAYEKPTAIQ
jgi:hypothetical protein